MIPLRDTFRFSTILTAIFITALVLRIAVAAAFEGLAAPPNPAAQPDQLDYEFLAFQMSSGAGYVTVEGAATARRPPGTSLTLLPVYVLFGRSFTLGRLWFCLLSALTCIAAAWLARDCYGPTVALVAALWLALYPGHFYYPMHFVSEVPYGLWLTLACAFTVRGLRSHTALNKWNVSAGLMWGVAILTRPQLLFGGPFAVLLIVVSRQRRRPFVACLGVQLCVITAVITPWIVRNDIVMGKPTLSTVGGHTFWGSNNSAVWSDSRFRGSWVRTSELADHTHPLTGTEIEREAAAWTYGFDFVARNPSKMPGLVAMKIWRLVSPLEDTSNKLLLWTFAAAWLLTMPWVIAGIGFAIKDGGTCTGVLLVPLLATFATAAVFYGSIRFRDSIIPLLLVLAARAVVRFKETRRVPARSG